VTDEECRSEAQRDAAKFVQEYGSRFASNDELEDLDMQMSLFAYSKVHGRH
jgi:hypothetical protein